MRAYFGELTAWIASVLEGGVSQGQFQLRDSAEADAQAFMSTLHGAMLTARAFGDPKVFATISGAAIKQLAGST
ncbi:hypothetical protein D3C85_1792190 [compost metagenome]